MLSRQIVNFPHPALKEVAAPVTCFDDELRELVEEMKVLMHAHEGVGLAATQVGESRQLLIVSSYAFLTPEERKVASADPTWEGVDHVVINPSVLTQSKEEELDYEGCLSFPEVYIKVSRPRYVKIEALNLEGEPITLEGEGFGARAILHEMDHLNGKVMTDHLSYLARQSALNKHKRVQRALRAQQGEEEPEELPKVAQGLKSGRGKGSSKVKTKSGTRGAKKTSSKSKKKR